LILQEDGGGKVNAAEPFLLERSGKRGRFITAKKGTYSLGSSSILLRGSIRPIILHLLLKDNSIISCEESISNGIIVVSKKDCFPPADREGSTPFRGNFFYLKEALPKGNNWGNRGLCNNKGPPSFLHLGRKSFWNPFITTFCRRGGKAIQLRPRASSSVKDPSK